LDAVVRVAEPHDASELIVLLRAAEQGSYVRATAGDVESFLARGGTEHLFVAQLGERLIGYAGVQHTESFAYARPTAELTELFVLPTYRRIGVGTKLVAAAIAYGEERKALEFFARVNRANVEAISLYEIAGLRQASHYEYRLAYY
jgi:GNAT superfamily N-acetyltransferase